MMTGGPVEALTGAAAALTPQAGGAGHPTHRAGPARGAVALAVGWVAGPAVLAQALVHTGGAVGAGGAPLLTQRSGVARRTLTGAGARVALGAIATLALLGAVLAEPPLAAGLAARGAAVPVQTVALARVGIAAGAILTRARKLALRPVEAFGAVYVAGFTPKPDVTLAEVRGDAGPPHTFLGADRDAPVARGTQHVALAAFLHQPGFHECLIADDSLVGNLVLGAFGRNIEAPAVLPHLVRDRFRHSHCGRVGFRPRADVGPLQAGSVLPT